MAADDAGETERKAAMRVLAHSAAARIAECLGAIDVPDHVDLREPGRAHALHPDRRPGIRHDHAAELRLVARNPEVIAGMARAIERALDMPFEEQTRRLRAMRGVVSQYTVFRWAAQLLVDGMRIEASRRITRSPAHACLR